MYEAVIFKAECIICQINVQKELTLLYQNVTFNSIHLPTTPSSSSIMAG